MSMQTFRVKKPSCKILKSKNCVPFEVQYYSSPKYQAKIYFCLLVITSNLLGFVNPSCDKILHDIYLAICRRIELDVRINYI